jgi:MoxR-like ATPase
MSMSVQQCAQRMREATREAAVGLVDREALVDLIVLAAVAREHVLVLGPPGTAKSAVVRSVAHILGGRYFEYLLGRFTEPNELFGPVDLRKLREGTVETQTTGMLPEADIAFLDEVFLGSTAILNTLLGILNERTFRRGHTHLKCPLKVCVGAANAMPLDESLAAFADRFLVHYFVAPLPDSLLEELLESGWSLRHDEDRHPGTWQDVDWLADAARRADLSGVRNALAHCVRLLRRTSVELSDRRIVRAQHLIAAAAVLAGRERPTASARRA